jgi:hypothetical protein
MTQITTPPPNRLTRLWTNPAIRTALVALVIFRLLTGAVAVIRANTAQSQAIPEFLILEPDGGAPDPHHDTYHGTYPATGLLRELTWMWFSWDTQWYVNIAYNGYGDMPKSVVFLPLYPLLIRATAALIGDYLLAALLVSFAASFAALALLYQVAVDQTGSDRLARRTLVLLLAFPTAFFLLAGYTESLFLALVLLAWLSTMRKWYGLAGLAGFLASLTRTQGILLALPLAYLAFWGNQPLRVTLCRLSDWRHLRDWRRLPLRDALPRLVAVSGPLLGSALYMGWIKLAGYGSITEVYTRYWAFETAPLWEALVNNLTLLLTHPNVVYVTNAVLFAIAIAGALLALRRLPLAYSLYTWVTIVVILMRQHNLSPFMSTGRFTLMLFPIFMVFAGALLRLEDRFRAGRLISLSVMEASVIWQIALLMEFARWGFVA